VLRLLPYPWPRGLFVGSFPSPAFQVSASTTRFMRTAELAPQEKNLVASVNFLLLVKLDLHSRCSWRRPASG